MKGFFAQRVQADTRLGRPRWTLFLQSAADGRNDAKADGLKVVRGGSFYDRPAWARSALRLAYEPLQAVFDVGFRVVCEADGAKAPANVASTGK